jgi:hypothetical protein
MVMGEEGSMDKVEQSEKAGMRRAFIKVADPEKGLTKAEYEAFCKQVGIKPRYRDDAADAPADAAEAEPDSTDDK